MSFLWRVTKNGDMTLEASTTETTSLVILSSTRSYHNNAKGQPEGYQRFYSRWLGKRNNSQIFPEYVLAPHALRLGMALNLRSRLIARRNRLQNKLERTESAIKVLEAFRLAENLGLVELHEEP